MGVYVFTWDKLRKYLIENENDETATKDFGKNIIPMMLNDDQKMYAYHFDGYWKDVGTLDSLWDANMDLLDPKVPLELYDKSWKIYARNNALPPQYIGNKAHVENSMITEGCQVNGNVDFSVLYSGVTVEEGATVNYSIVMPGSVIKAGAVVEYSIVGSDCVVEGGAHIGSKPEAMENCDQWGIAVVGHNNTVVSGQNVKPKEIYDE